MAKETPAMLKALVALVLGGLSVVARGADAPAPWEPEEFVVSYWCGPPAKFNTLERYKEIKAANFTYAAPIYGGATVEQIKQQLDYCQQVGLKAFIYDSRMSSQWSESLKGGIDGMVKDYASHPALAGYSIADEPAGAAFPSLGKIVAYLKEKDPKHPGYINLFPTYVREHGNVMGYPTYEEHVRKYVEIVKPFVISYDHYHFTEGGDRVDFWENLATVRKVALESNLPFWNIVLVTKHGGYRHLTEPELRFEAMQTLAYGGKGLLWFTYWSPAAFDKSFNWSHAMVDENGNRDPHYDMVKGINADVLAMGSELMRATSTSVYQIGSVPPFCVAPPADAPVTTADKVELTVGVFESKDGRPFACVANRDYKNAAKFTAALPAGTVEVFDRPSRAWRALEGKALEIGAGDAVMLRW
jgi:hypothetical protein